MPRYIDADKVMEEISRIGGHNLCEWETLGVRALIDRQPAADVVPKSEVEKLKVLLEVKEIAYEGLRELYHVDIDALVAARRKTEVEVAREIFEEIEEMLNLLKIYNPYDSMLNVVGQNLVELKKKYTESEEGE